MTRTAETMSPEQSDRSIRAYALMDARTALIGDAGGPVDPHDLITVADWIAYGDDNLDLDVTFEETGGKDPDRVPCDPAAGDCCKGSAHQPAFPESVFGEASKIISDLLTRRDVR